MAWSFVAAGTVVASTTTSITLVEPAGAANGDLLIAAISLRTTSTTSLSLPSGWTLVEEEKTNDVTAASSSSIASGTMAYAIRGGSESYVFPIPSGISVAQGVVVAYRGTGSLDALTTSTSTTLAAGATAVSVTGLTTTVANELIVVAICNARNSVGSGFDATNPSVVSTTGGQTGGPTVNTWLERVEGQSSGGADTGIAIGDAIRGTAGATGNLLYLSGSSGRHAVLAASFKIIVLGTANITGGVTLACNAVSDAIPPQQWDSANNHANHTISNGGLRVIKTVNDFGVHTSTRAVDLVVTGKKYWELEIIVSTGVVDVGLGTTGFNTAADISNQATGIAWYTFEGTGGVAYENGFVDNLPAYAVDDRISIAVNADSNKMWGRVNGGTWGPSGDPAADTGGIALASALYTNGLAPAVSLGDLNDQVDAFFSAASWSYAAPSGFSSFDLVTPKQGQANLTGSVAFASVATIRDTITESLTASVTIAANATHTPGGTAAFVGSGTFIANSLRVTFGTAAFVGNLTLLPTNATHTPVGAAAFVGSATFVSVAIIVDTIAETLSGSSIFVANSSHTPVGETAFVGVGALVSVATLRDTITADFAGSSAFVVDATHTPAGAAAFVGSVIVSTVATIADTITADFAGNSTFVASATHTPVGETTITGSVVVAINATIVDTITEVLTGGGEIFVSPVSLLAGQGGLAGNATFVSEGEHTPVGAAEFAGAVDLSVVPAIVEFAAAADFVGIATFVSTEVLHQNGVADITGAATLIVDPAIVQLSSADFVGNATFALDATHTPAGAAAFSGVATFVTETVTHQSVETNFVGSATLVVTPVAHLSATALLFGEGAITADRDPIVFGLSDFTGAATLSVDATHTADAVASFTESATLFVDTNVLQSGVSVLSGTATFVVDSLVVKEAAADFVGSATLIYTFVLHVAGAADFFGSGTIVVRLGEAIDATAAITGAVTLVAAPVMLASGVASISAGGTLAFSGASLPLPYSIERLIRVPGVSRHAIAGAQGRLLTVAESRRNVNSDARGRVLRYTGGSRTLSS